MSRSIKASKSKSALKKSKKPGEAVGPANLVEELAIDEAAALVVGGSTGEDSDADDDEARDAPQEGSLIEQGEEAVGKGVDEEGDEGEPEVNEELVPRLGLVGRMHKRDGVHHKGAAEEGRGGSQDDIAGSVDPARHVADAPRPPGPADESTPVILPAGGGVGGEELGQGGSQAEVADAGDHEPPDDGAGPARGEGEADGGGQGGPGVEDGKGEAEQGDLGEVPLELLLVAELLEGGRVVKLDVFVGGGVGLLLLLHDGIG